MASLPSPVSDPTKLLATSRESCDQNSHTEKFGWDDPMFIYEIQLHLPTLERSYSCYNDCTELILKTFGHVIVDGNSGKICISSNLYAPEK